MKAHLLQPRWSLTRMVSVAMVFWACGICWGADQVKAPEFSVQRGHYSAPFTVTLASDTPGATIRYTTGSEWPSETKGTLGNSVNITTTTVVRAIAYKSGLLPSEIMTHTYIFIEDVIRQPKNAKGTPDGLGSFHWKSTEMNQSSVNEYTDRVRAALASLPILSVSGDPLKLFGNGVNTQGMMEDYRDRKEEKVSLEMIYQNGSGDFLGHCGFRTAGNASQMAAKKSFGLEFRSMYGQKNLRYPLIPGSHVEKFDEIRLRSTWSTISSPYYMQWADDMQRAMSGEGHNGRFVQLYVNGIYWGLYNPSEIGKEGFGEAHLGGDKDNWRRVRGNPALSNALLPIMGDVSDPAKYEAFKKKLNVEHYTDLLLLLMWLVDLDNRTLDIEIRAIKNDKDGFPYHTYMWDPEEARTRSSNLDVNPLPYALDKNPLLQKLLTSTDYRILFADRIRKHLTAGGTLTTGGPAEAALLARVAEVETAYAAEAPRWEMTDSYEFRMLGLGFGGRINSDHWTFRNTWIPKRANVLLGFFREAGLYPALDAPDFSQNGGEVNAGFQLSISGSGGTLYYTIDGSDPRVEGSGAVRASAQTGALPATLTINQTVQVRARLKTGSTWSALTEAVFTVAQDFTKLRITELMYHPPLVGLIDGDEYEFLELKNTGSAALVLSGAQFSNGLTFRFHGTRIIPAGGFVVLVKNPVRFAQKYPGVTIDGNYTGSLSNGGEAIELSASDGTVIVSMVYDDKAPWPLAPDGPGFSLVPTNPNPSGDANDATQWRTSANLGGSPGADDPEPPPVVAIIINEVLSHTDLPQKDSIELHNPTNQSASIGGWYLTDDNQIPQKFRIPFGTVIAPGGYLTFNEDDFNADPVNDPNSFGLSSLGEEAFLFSADNDGVLTGYSHGFNFDAAKNGVSFGRYTISTGDDHYPAQISPSFGAVNAGPKIGPVIINELMYHPLDTGDEYVELKNISNASVKLYDPAYPQNTWRLSGVSFDFPTNVEIPAGGLLLAVGIDPAAFRSKYNVPSAVQIVGPYLGKLSNGGESVSLKAPEGPTVDNLGNPIVPMYLIDKVKYDDVSPWPTSPDGSGTALARKDAGAYGNDPINWEASEAGGTPGTDGPLTNQLPQFTSGPSASPAAVQLPGTVNVSVAAIDPDSGPAPLTYAWSKLSGPGTVSFSPTNAANATASFSVAGSYTLQVSVSDGEGSVSGNVDVTVSPANQAPVAAFTATPATGVAPLDVQLDASGSSDDSGISSYAWNFGDGSAGSNAGPVVNHSFANAGSYTATLTVTDASGLSDSVTQTITATSSGSPPGTVTLVARDQFGQDVPGAMIYVRELGTWHAAGAQIQLTVGSSYRIKGKISNASGPEFWQKILDTTTEVLVPFWTATLVSEDQFGASVSSAQIRVRYYFEEWFTSGKAVTLPKGYSAQVYGKVANANGPRVYFKFTDGLTEINPGFHTATLAARDQFGADVTGAQVQVRYSPEEWYAPGDSVSMPLGYNAQVYGKNLNATGPRTYALFDANLTEIDPGFWTFTVRTRDQFGAVVIDGFAQLRYVTGEYFSDGTVLTLPEGDVIKARSRRKNLYSNVYDNVTFTAGVEVFAAKFRSILFKAVATDGSTVVPGAEIDLYRSQIARFANNTRKGVPVPDTIRVKVYKDGVLIADVNPASVDEASDVLIIPTTFEAAAGNLDPVIDSPPVANPNPVEMDQVVAFSVGATDADNDTLTYAWNFGDGTGGSGTNPSHTYNTAGTFTVNVTVTDGNGGSASATLGVVVNDTVAPVLDVTTVILKGNVSDASGIASLKVDGQTVTVQADGSWQREVSVAGASTTVTVQATDAEGNVTTKTVTIGK